MATSTTLESENSLLQAQRAVTLAPINNTVQSGNVQIIGRYLTPTMSLIRRTRLRRDPDAMCPPQADPPGSKKVLCTIDLATNRQVCSLVTSTRISMPP